jgi:hypothetical protein
MFARQRSKLFLHFGVGHRILRVPAVVFDPHRFLRSGFQHDLEVAQIVVLLVHVGFRRRDAAYAADEVEQARIMQVRVLVVVVVDRAVHQYHRRRIRHTMVGSFVT